MATKTSRLVQRDYRRYSTGSVASPNAVGLPLTETEQRQMLDCEDVIRQDLMTFFDVGSALLTIRENRLYRAEYATFEVYCRERWNIGRSYAWRLIGAAERLRLLPPDTAMPRPINECQIRPFLKLEPGEFPKAWNEALARAKDGKLTEKMLSDVVSELCDCKRHSAQAKRRTRLRKRGDAPLGNILVLLHEAKQLLLKGEAERAIATMDKIEVLLFSASPTL